MSDPSLQRYVNAMLAVAKFYIGVTKMYLGCMWAHGKLISICKL